MVSKDQYEQDCKTLKKAMEGWGTDEAPIIDITSKRSNSDRQEILKFYKSSYGKDLIKELDSELGGYLKKTVIAMFRTPIDYDCMELYAAMKGVGTNEDTLTEIIGSRPPAVLTEIKKRFKELYKEELETWVKDETSGDYKKLLVSLLQCCRSDNKDLNTEKLENDVKELYEAGENKIGTDEQVFNRIFSLRSYDELKYINKKYKLMLGKDLFAVIDSEFSGDIKKLLRTVLHVAIDVTDYFAERIRWACKGAGTNDEVLIRCLVSRDEIDLKQIKEIYVKKFNKSLYQEIKDETSGDYKNILLGIAMTD